MNSLLNQESLKLKEILISNSALGNKYMKILWELDMKNKKNF